MSDPKKPAPEATKADAAKDDSKGLTEAQVARKIDAKIIVPHTNKEGVTKLIETKVGGEHVLSFREDGNEIIAVTADGQKHTVAA